MIPLRPYQTSAIDLVRAAAQAGGRAICLVLPTGAGKTVCFAEIIRRACLDHGKRALVLSHRGEIVDQTVAALRARGVAAGALSASAAAAADSAAPCQVATVQTLIARGARPPADIVIADEAHHYCAADWRACLADFRGALIIGPTATPERADGVGLGEVFDRLVVGARAGELIASGYLVPPHILRPAAPLKARQIALRPIDAYEAHARGRRALVFCPRVGQANKALQEFRQAGRRAALVTGETPWTDRRRMFSAIRDGRLDAIVNVNVAGEGFDVPEIDCVILARPFPTAGAFLQAAGRGLRPAPGKSDLLLLDLCGATHAHGSPADDREYSLEGRGIRKAAERAAQSYCRVCGAPIDPGAGCAECGVDPRPDNPLRVVNVPLEPYARKRAEAAPDRIATLRRWVAEGRAKGYKPGWAIAKFTAVYGGRPPPEIWRAAQ